MKIKWGHHNADTEYTCVGKNDFLYQYLAIA